MKTKSTVSAFIFSSLLASSVVPRISLAYQETSDYQGTEAALLTPWTVFENTVRSYAGPRRVFEQKSASSNWKIGQFNWSLSGLRWQFVSDFESGHIGPGEIRVNSKNIRFNLEVAKASIDQVIEQVVSGAVVRIRVRASCGPLRLSQNTAQADARLTYEFSPRTIVTKLDQFEMHWADQSWTIEPFACEGPKGFPETLQQELLGRLQSADGLRPWIHEVLKEKIQSELNSSIERIKKPRVLPMPQGVLPLQVEFAGFDSRPEGLITRARLVWAKVPTTAVRGLSIEDWPTQIPEDRPTLIMPQEGLSDYVTQTIASQPEETKVDLREANFFKKLMKSRFLQFFLWKDLMKYSKKSPFYLSIHRPEMVKINWKADGSANVSLLAASWVQSYRDGRWWDYLFVKARATADLSPEIENGYFKLQAELSQSKIETTMGEEYIRTFNPNTHVASGVLNSVVTEVGKNFNYRIQMPRLDLGVLGSAEAESWTSLSNWSVAVPFLLHP